MFDAIIAAVFLGAVSTMGDFVWAELRLSHKMIYGIVHGAVICLAIGSMVGMRSKSMIAGALLGPVVGVLGAGTYYLLAPMLGWGALAPAWMLLWIAFGFLATLLGGKGGMRVAFARGAAAAVLSGVAFWAISGIWTSPSPEGPNYARHFFSWTFAFLPGFAALFWE
jgi:hypothetical protein